MSRYSWKNGSNSLLKKLNYQQFLITFFCKDKKSKEMSSTLSFEIVDIFLIKVIKFCLHGLEFSVFSIGIFRKNAGYMV
jgi:hypothetical protein